MIPHYQRWNALDHADAYHVAAMQRRGRGLAGALYSPKRLESKAGTWQRAVDMAQSAFRNACADARAAYQWDIHGRDAVADVEL